MKKMILILLSLAVAVSAVTAFCDGVQWFCPNCGHSNSENYCTQCGRARPSDGTWTCPSCGRTGNTENFCPNCGANKPSGQSAVNPVTANLKMQLSTRSGPGVNYDEPGTFYYRDNQWQSVRVNVLGKKYSGVWWVLVDFDYGGFGRVRAWTGLKRVDVDLDLLPEINETGTGTVYATSDTYYGPGSNYAKAPDIKGTKSVTVYGRENGYVEVEYRVSSDTFYRCWVPEGCLH